MSAATFHEHIAAFYQNRATLPHVPVSRLRNLDGSPVVAWPVLWQTDAGVYVTDPTGDLHIANGVLTGGRLVHEHEAAQGLELLDELPDIASTTSAHLHLVEG